MQGLTHAFLGVNKAANTSTVTSTNLSKSRCVINLNALLPIKFAAEEETHANAYEIRSVARTAVSTPFQR